VTGSNGLVVRVLISLTAAASVTACAASSPEAGRPNTAPATSVTQPAAAVSSPLASPPERPEAAYGLTLAAAELFIRHYVDLMNYAAATGDTTAMRSVSAKGCVGCGKYYASVEQVNEQDGGLIGDYRERVVEVTELTRTGHEKVSAATNVTVGSYTARQSPSATPVVIKASPYTEEMVLAADGGNWQMFEMELRRR
jgi:hypothetical protein